MHTLFFCGWRALFFSLFFFHFWIGAASLLLGFPWRLCVGSVHFSKICQFILPTRQTRVGKTTTDFNWIELNCVCSLLEQPVGTFPGSKPAKFNLTDEFKPNHEGHLRLPGQPIKLKFLLSASVLRFQEKSLVFLHYRSWYSTICCCELLSKLPSVLTSLCLMLGVLQLGIWSLLYHQTNDGELVIFVVCC